MISRPQMLSKLKAALTLLCLFVLTADALRAMGMENAIKKRRQMLYRRREPLPGKRDVQTQTITVRLAPLDGLRDPGWLTLPSSSLSITSAATTVPSRTGTGTTRRSINPAVLYSVRAPRKTIPSCAAHARLEQSLILESPTPKISPQSLR